MLKLHISNVIELSKMEGTLQFSVNCQSFVYLAYWFKVNYLLSKFLKSAEMAGFSLEILIFNRSKGANSNHKMARGYTTA